MVTTLPGHEVKLGTSTVQTLDGGDAMDPRSESTPASSGSSTDPVASATVNVTVPVVNNGPGIAKGLVTAPSTSNTVIQASFVNVSSAPGGTAAATIRPSMQPATLTINGNNSNASCVLTAAPSVATATGTTPLTNAQPPVNVNASPAVSIKAESPQTVIQSAAHSGSPQVSPGAAKGAGLMHATTAVRGGVPVTGGGAPVAAAAAGGVRAIAPQQVLAPRLPQSTPGQTSIHNIQLPPGTPNFSILVQTHHSHLLFHQSQTSGPRAQTVRLYILFNHIVSCHRFPTFLLGNPMWCTFQCFPSFNSPTAALLKISEHTNMCQTRGTPGPELGTCVSCDEQLFDTSKYRKQRSSLSHSGQMVSCRAAQYAFMTL